MFDMELALSSEFDATVSELRLRAQTAAYEAMKSTMALAETTARAAHTGIAGWRNESGNLERTITGYAIPDPTMPGAQSPGRSVIYAHASDVVVPQVGDSRLRPPRSKYRKQRLLDQHYRVDPTVSPPVSGVPNEVIGILHKYMQYANYLPYTAPAGGSPGSRGRSALTDLPTGELLRELSAVVSRGL